MSDLADEIEQYFDKEGIRHERGESPSPADLLERYLYHFDKVIVPGPRRVHFSAELRAALGTLDGRYGTAIEAIKSRFEAGGDLAEFLSRKAADAGFKDRLPSDFGIHHFHLGAKSALSERHVRRTGDLLFVFVQPLDA
ncbi:hypothetical protein [Candidatus Poriferisocius sp.]|uniref:hypothetical protein n=1 Tax=Candidatus Poriferisocius sp. TaxID=3101276 RepID=UPI003B51C06C